jgi:hypothetical protein
LIGAALGIIVVVMRLWLPEGRRWMMTYGFAARARAIVSDIEEQFRRRGRWIARIPAAHA